MDTCAVAVFLPRLKAAAWIILHLMHKGPARGPFFSASCPLKTNCQNCDHDADAVSACEQTQTALRYILKDRRTAGALGVSHRRPCASRLQMAAGIAMRQVQPSSQLHDIVHPTCPKCGAAMWLTRIAPDGPGWEQRTFECQACQNETIDIVRGTTHNHAK